MKVQRNPLDWRGMAIFLVGIGLGFLAWDHLTLPFSNPMEVVGPPSLHRWNPLNDIFRFAVFVGLPSGFLVFFHLLPFPRLRKAVHSSFPEEKIKSKKGEAFGKNISFGLFLVVLAVLFSLNAPTYHAFGLFDPFHEGESLGAAMSSLDHQVPYRDYFFFHGVFQDPQRSTLAFQWFGQSIGSQRTLESILKVGTWILLSLLLGRIFLASRFFAFTALVSIAVFYVPFLFNVSMEPFIRPHQPEAILAVFQEWESWLACFHWIILSGRDLLPLVFLLAFLRILEQTE